MMCFQLRLRLAHGTALVLASFLLLVLGGCGDGGPNAAAPTSSPYTVDAGAVKLKIHETLWRMEFLNAAGAPFLLESTATGTGPVGALGLNIEPPPEGNGQVSALTPIREGMLADHGTDPAIVHLSDRINQTRLLSFPD